MSDRRLDDDRNDDSRLSDDVVEARSLAGVWADLDWEKALDELDRIRHESQPTPPIDDV